MKVRFTRNTVHKLQNLQQQQRHPQEALAWVGGRSDNGIIRSGFEEEAATLLGGGSVDKLLTPVKLKWQQHVIRLCLGHGTMVVSVPVWLCPYEIIALTDRSGSIMEAIPETISLKRNDAHYMSLANAFLDPL